MKKEKSREQLTADIKNQEERVSELENQIIKNGSEGKVSGKNLENVLNLDENMMALIEAIGDGVSIQGTDFKILYQNKKLKQYFGDHLGEQCYEAYRKNERPCQDCHLAASFLDGKEKKVQKLTPTIIGPKYLEITESPIRDPNGEIIAGISIVRDIDDWKITQQKLEESEERYRDLFENANDLIQSIDSQGKFLYVNQKWTDTLGYSQEEVRKMTFMDILHKDYLPHCMVLFDEICKGEEVEMIETVFLTKDGIEIPVEGNINALYGDGKLVATRGIFRDITERKKAEDELRFEREKLRLLYENNPDAIIIMDRDLNIIYANHRVEDISGVKASFIKGKKCHSVTGDRMDICDTCKVKEVINEKKAKSGIKHETNASGKESWLWQLWYPILDFEGNVDSVVEIARDITEMKLAEKAMERYAKELEASNRMKDLFSDIMHHDLLNPMGIIKTTAELNLEDNPEDEESRTIFDNVMKAMKLIENATILSHLESSTDLEFVDLDLMEMIEEVTLNLAPIFENAQVKLINNITKSMPIKANPLIGNVFTNLLTNAVKYAQEGKKVIIESQDLDDNYRISVSDFGMGIPQKERKEIFTRFKRTHRGSVRGSGLGLAIVLRMVKIHGGTVMVEDNPEGGTVFVVELPK